MTAELVRPKCFEFAMEFLGGPEDEIVRTYVEALESALSAETLLRKQIEHERDCILESLAGAERDAERYRWLVPQISWRDWYDLFGLNAGHDTPERIDAAIDTAIKAQGTGDD